MGGAFQKDGPSDGSNGLSVGNARLALGGALAAEYGYNIQWDFVNSSSLLDAELFKKLNKSIKVRAGLFKVPFSGEFLTGAPSVDMINRAQVVNFLAPNRRVGVELSGDYQASHLFWKFGLFNDSRGLSNSDNDLLAAYRLGLTSQKTDSRFELAGNVAISNDDDVTLDFATPNTNFTGERFLAGFDFRWQSKDFFVSGEAIGAWLDGSNGEYHRLYGYQLTGGVVVWGFTGLIRWDSFRAESLGTESELLVLGMTSEFSDLKNLSYQVDYVLPTKSNGEQKLLFSLDLLI